MNLPVDSLPKTEIVRPVKQWLRTAAWPLARSGADPERPRPARDEREADFSIKKSGGSGMPPPLRLVRPTSRFRTSFKFGLAAAYFADPPLHVHGGLLVHMLLLLPPSLAPPRPLEPSTPHSHLLEASARAGCGKLLAAPRGATASSSRCCGDSECARCPEHCACRDGRSDITASPLCSMRICAANWPARAGRPPTAWASL